MSEGRGLTLRKKRKDRPAISGPTPVSGANANAPRPGVQQQKSAASLASNRVGPTETSDLVKRRYSTRYNQLPDFSNLDAPPVPGLPLVGNALKRGSRGGSPRRPARESTSHPLKVDQDILNDPNLQHERYVTDLLSNASSQEIQDYQASLRKIKTRTSTNLQQSVYQNRTQFIKISKEAEKLKTEMQVLRGLMADLTGALQTTAPSDSLSDTSTSSLSRRNTNRSSVANLESMWNIQLQALWKNVEKSQKFLPAIPGRHIIMENGSWIELDSATWKPKRPIHLVLLNDHLLIASKKRKRLDPNAGPQTGPAPTKLVAEECFTIPSIDIIDMSSTANTNPSTPAEEKTLQSAFTIRTGSRSLTYRHEKRDPLAKSTFLQTFRKAVEDLRKANKITTSQTSPQLDSLNYFATRDHPTSAHNADILSSLTSTITSSSSGGTKIPDILIEVDGKQQSFRWVESQIDDLDIDIALQRFDLAVTTVEKLRALAKSNISLKTNSIAQELILVKVDERANKLAAVLCRDLIDTPSYMNATKSTVAYLTRLGYEDRARTAYLDARSKSLEGRARQCVFEGDLHKYIFGLTYVYFTLVKNTIMIYQASFSQGWMSAVIKWANGHLGSYNEVLRRQLSSVERGGVTWRECMDVVWEHERGLLGGEGLDFREVVGRGLEMGPAKESGGREGREGEARREKSGSRSKSRARTPA